MYYLTKNKPSFFRKNQSKVLLAFWIVLSLSVGGGTGVSRRETI